MHLDTGSDLTIINEKTWEEIGKPKLCSPNKIGYGATERRFYFRSKCICNIMFTGRNKNVDVYVLKRSTNLFGNKCMEKFNSWDTPIRTLCNNVNRAVKPSNEVDEQNKKIKGTF